MEHLLRSKLPELADCNPQQQEAEKEEQQCHKVS